MATLSNEDYAFLNKGVKKKKKKKAAEPEPKTFKFPEKPPANDYALEIGGLIIAFITTLFIVFALPIIFGF